MGSVTSAILSGASALRSFQYALNVTQNNIDNASTPGYAAQQVSLEASPFDPATGLGGGVSDGSLVDTRDLLAESDVWQQAGLQGEASAQSNALADIQNALPVGSGAGIPDALNGFFSNVSAWSAAPASPGAMQNVMLSAGALAQTFQTTAANVAGASATMTLSINDTVAQINRLTAQIAATNHAIQDGGAGDQGLQAQLYSSLETLSGLVNISALQVPEGGVNVTLSNGDALVMGGQQFALSTGNAPPPAASADPQAPPDINVYGADGSVVNGQISSGTLAGLLQVRNVTIPGLIGNASQPGALNTLASTLADAVNSIVGAGFVSQGPPPVPAPAGLFTYDQNSASAAASTLAVDPDMNATQLPAIDAAGIANGVPLDIMALANLNDAALGSNFTTFYGNAAAQVGSLLNTAQTNQATTAQTLAQAQSMRQSASGVSLDTEAANVLQFQAGYQAVAKMLSTLATLTQSLIDIIPSA